MLSRFAYGAGSTSLSRCLVKFQPITAITGSAALSSLPESEGDNEFSRRKYPPIPPKSANPPPEFPAPASERDFVNFPRPINRVRSPPVRFGFIPDSWFQFFYPKTGYTGPYMLIFGGLTYIYSKEILPCDHNAAHLYSFILLVTFIHCKFGDKIGEAYNKHVLEENLKIFEETEEKERIIFKEGINEINEVLALKGDVLEVLKGRIEAIYLQMEMNYRKRLEETYHLVKSKLDCQAELESAENRVAQKNLLDYVLRNVMKSITPELESNMLQNCISNLNALSAKA